MTVHPFPNAPVEITVFSKPGCPQCMTTVRHLDRLGLPYTYRDVTAGDMHWSSYRNEKLKRLAEIHGVAGDISWLDEPAAEYLEDGVV